MHASVPELDPRQRPVGMHLLDHAGERGHVLDAVAQRLQAEAQAAMDREADGLADGVPGADDRYSDALDSWLALGGADFDDPFHDDWPHW